MSSLDITQKELMNLSDEELTKLLKSLVEYVGTPDEPKARMLQQDIYDERIRRRDYGF